MSLTLCLHNRKWREIEGRESEGYKLPCLDRRSGRIHFRSLFNQHHPSKIGEIRKEHEAYLPSPSLPLFPLPFLLFPSPPLPFPSIFLSKDTVKYSSVPVPSLKLESKCNLCFSYPSSSSRNLLTVPVRPWAITPKTSPLLVVHMSMRKVLEVLFLLLYICSKSLMFLFVLDSQFLSRYLSSCYMSAHSHVVV